MFYFFYPYTMHLDPNVLNEVDLRQHEELVQLGFSAK